jgi:nicotinate-nucleotide pyrophosphorylase (carboxylating)
MAHTTPSASFVGISATGKALLRQGLADDGWPWDWTSLGSLKDPLKKVKAQVIAKAHGVWAGASLVKAVENLAKEIGAENGMTSPSFFSAKIFSKDGASVKPGQSICEWTGPASLILALERPFLNLASYSSGIATATRELVSQVERACPRKTPKVTATRKTLPGYRDLAIYGLQVGGGFSHRVSLSGGVLIKENHIASAGSITRAIAGCRAVAPHGLKIEVEVTSIRELEEALAAQAEVILLDNFSVEEVRKAILLVDKRFVTRNTQNAKAGNTTPLRPVIEISGGLNISNIARYAIPGVDILSVGSITLSVQGLDLSLLVKL